MTRLITRPTRPLICALLLACALPLSSCGITGSLKTPPPIFGEKADNAAETTPETTAEDSIDTREERLGLDEDDSDPFDIYEDDPNYDVEPDQ